MLQLPEEETKCPQQQSGAAVILTDGFKSMLSELGKRKSFQPSTSSKKPHMRKEEESSAIKANPVKLQLQRKPSMLTP